MNEPLMTVKEVAYRLGVSAKIVYTLKDRPNGLRAYKVGKCVRFKPSDVEAYLEANVVKPPEPQDVLPNMVRFKYVPGMKVV